MKILPVAAVAIVAMMLTVCFVQYDGGRSDDGYLYAIYTDADSNMDVIDVFESHIENRTATGLVQRYRTSDSSDGINSFWTFDKTSGKGPFNSFYAAINLSDDGPAYDTDDSSQTRKSTSAGCVGYILNPYDLSKTIEGNTFDSRLYNVMLIIPTVYWLSEKVTADETSGNLVKGKEYNVLYVSSSPDYPIPGRGAITGMKAYAHSASYVPGKADFETNVYPYLGIGVYESYATTAEDPFGADRIVSQSGRTPTAHTDVDEFKNLVDSLVPASGSGLRSDYQQWNYYQWLLYKIMCYTVMGSKNTQVMVGDGYVQGNDSPAVTGSTDRIGFIGNAEETRSGSGKTSSDNGRTSSKLFIENSWGSLNIFLGDACVIGGPSDLHLYAGNYLGGESMIASRDLPSTGEGWANVYAIDGNPHRVILTASASSSTWDTPLSSNGNEATFIDPAYPGDIVNSSKDSGVFSITVGGRWDKGQWSGIAFACAGYDIGLENEYRGARLAYLMSDDAL